MHTTIVLALSLAAACAGQTIYHPNGYFRLGPPTSSKPSEPAPVAPRGGYRQPQQPAAYAEPDYMKPEPDYMKPKPHYMKPEPDYMKPKPDYMKPEPDYMKPEPDYMKPEPDYMRHEPMYQQTKPTYVYRQPVYHQPSYHYEQQYQRPAEAYYPRPSYQRPQKLYYGAPQEQQQPAYEMTTPKPPMTTTTTYKPEPQKPAVEEEPEYLGTFKNAKNMVEGHIYKLSDNSLYIQGFSFDGRAPDVHFWSDGVSIPFYTRSNPKMQDVVHEMHNEDIVLMLPPEKPTVEALGHFQVWCRQYRINFGEFRMS